MVTNCYSCKKEIGMFDHRGTTIDILRAGFTPPDEMSKHDRLCQECLNQFKTTQVRGQKLNERVNLAGQIILCIIFPLVAFWRINRLLDFLFYWVVIIGIVIVTVVVGVILDNETDSILIDVIVYFLGGMVLLGGFLPLYWIIKWTNEYNRNSI